MEPVSPSDSQPSLTEKPVPNAWVALMVGVAMLTACFLVVILLGSQIGRWVGGDGNLAAWFAEKGADSPGMRHLFRVYLGLSNLLIWGLAAWLWAKWHGKPGKTLSITEPPEFRLAFHAVFLLLIAFPLIFAGVLDWEMVQLPDFLSGVETWLKEKETLTSGHLKVLLFDASPAALVANLLVVAVVPAISEEFFFRGFLLKTFMRKMNPYLAILLTAFLFSAMHLQLAGFIPRFLLGLILGLVFYYSRNLWLCSVVHFSNNALAVFGTWVGAKQGGDLPDAPSSGPDIPLYLAAASLVGAILILYWFFRRTETYRTRFPLERELLGNS